ncbi:DUF1947 domain-containing protein [Candidatus Bathyarchaeota archaeon]|nr:DUF1947 domain-containing protein [Candidatus Bathyarchaeota archaeon]
MSKGFKRCFVRSKEAKRIIKDASERLGLRNDVLMPNAKVELVETDFCQLFLVNGEPILFKVDEKIFPTLFFNEAVRFLPKVVVDMGAVPHVCNGANVMAPGVVCLEGNFNRGEVVVVIDERHGKPLAIGESLFTSLEFSEMKHGTVVKNFHFVGDKIWKLARSLIDKF